MIQLFLLLFSGQELGQKSRKKGKTIRKGSSTFFSNLPFYLTLTLFKKSMERIDISIIP